MASINAILKGYLDLRNNPEYAAYDEVTKTAIKEAVKSKIGKLQVQRDEQQQQPEDKSFLESLAEKRDQVITNALEPIAEPLMSVLESAPFRSAAKTVGATAGAIAGAPIGGPAVGGAVGAATGFEAAKRTLQALGLEKPDTELLPDVSKPSPVYAAGQALERTVRPVYDLGRDMISGTGSFVANMALKGAADVRQKTDAGMPVDEAIKETAIENGPTAAAIVASPLAGKLPTQALKTVAGYAVPTAFSGMAINEAAKMAGDVAGSMPEKSNLEQVLEFGRRGGFSKGIESVLFPALHLAGERARANVPVSEPLAQEPVVTPEPVSAVVPEPAPVVQPKSVKPANQKQIKYASSALSDYGVPAERHVEVIRQITGREDANIDNLSVKEANAVGDSIRRNILDGKKWEAPESKLIPFPPEPRPADPAPEPMKVVDRRAAAGEPAPAPAPVSQRMAFVRDVLGNKRNVPLTSVQEVVDRLRGQIPEEKPAADRRASAQPEAVKEPPVPEQKPTVSEPVVAAEPPVVEPPEVQIVKNASIMERYRKARGQQEKANLQKQWDSLTPDARDEAMLHIKDKEAALPIWREVDKAIIEGKDPTPAMNKLGSLDPNAVNEARKLIPEPSKLDIDAARMTRKEKAAAAPDVKSETPVMDAVESLGKIKPKGAQGDKAKGEYDGQPKLDVDYQGKVFSSKNPNSLEADRMARDLQSVHGIGDGTTETMWKLIDTEAKARKSGKEQAASLLDVEKQNADWEKNQSQVVTADKLKVGEEFTIKGEKFKVIEENDSSLKLKDGVEVDVPYEGKDSRIRIDKGSLKEKAIEAPAPEMLPAPAEKSMQARPLYSVEYLIAKGLKKAITYGTNLLRQGVTTFVDWSRKMAAQFGDTVKGQLVALWKAAKNGFMGTVEGRRGAVGIRDKIGGMSEKDITKEKDFVEWFGDFSKSPEASSKVVENGKPKKVFHGTTEDFLEFDESARGTNTNAEGAEMGFFFAGNKADTTIYIDMAKERNFRQTGEKKQGRVIEAYLDIKKPLILTPFEEANVGKEVVDRLIDNDPLALEYAKDNGYDGVIWPHGNMNNSDYTAVVFDKKQIRIANDGKQIPANENSKKESVVDKVKAALGLSGIEGRRGGIGFRGFDKNTIKKGVDIRVDAEREKMQAQMPDTAAIKKGVDISRAAVRESEQAKAAERVAKRDAQIADLKRSIKDIQKSGKSLDERKRLLGQFISKNVKDGRSFRQALSALGKAKNDVAFGKAAMRIAEIAQVSKQTAEFRKEYVSTLKAFQKANKEKGKMHPAFQAVLGEATKGVTDASPTVEKQTKRFLDRAAKLVENDDIRGLMMLPEQWGETIANLRNKKSLRLMSPAELRELRDTVNYISHLSKTSQNLIFEGRQQDVNEASDEILKHAEKVKEQLVTDQKAVAGQNRKPEVQGWLGRLETSQNSLPSLARKAFGVIGEKVFGKDFWKAENKSTGLIDKANETVSNWRKQFGFESDKKFQDWQNQEVEIEVSGSIPTVDQAKPAKMTPEKVKLSRAEFLDLAAALGDTSTRNRLMGKNLEGGNAITLGDRPSAKRFILSEADMAKIEKSLTPAERELVAQAKKYLSDVLVPEMDKAHVSLMGYPLKKIAGYWPRRVSMSFSQGGMNEAFQKALAASFESLGMLKERTEHSKPIVIGNIMDSFSRHVNSAAEMAAFGVPMRNARMVLANPKVRLALDKYLGKNVEDTIDQVLMNVVLRSQKGSDPAMGAISKLSANAGRASLSLNPLSGARGLFGIGNLPSEFSNADLKSGISSVIKNGKAIMAELLQSPYFKKRANLVGESIVSVDAELPDLLSKKRQYGFITGADNIVSAVAWEAAKAEVKRNNPSLSGQAFLDAVSERAEEAVRRTQNPVSVLDSAPMIQEWNKSEVTRPAVQFKSQGPKNLEIYRRLYDRARDGEISYQEALGKALASIASQQLGKALSIRNIGSVAGAGLVAAGMMKKPKEEKKDNASLFRKVFGAAGEVLQTQVENIPAVQAVIGNALDYLTDDAGRLETSRTPGFTAVKDATESAKALRDAIGGYLSGEKDRSGKPAYKRDAVKTVTSGITAGAALTGTSLFWSRLLSKVIDAAAKDALGIEKNENIKAIKNLLK